VAVLLALTALLGQSGCANAPTPVPWLSKRPFPAMTERRGVVEGRVFLTRDASSASGASDPLQVVVYLDRLDEDEDRPSTSRDASIEPTEGPLWPEPMVVALDQTIRFANDDQVYHRVFSSSETNGFDLGLLKTGESRELTLRSVGIVRVYCSLHPWESGSIFVAPSLRFHTVEPPGRYEIGDVPPGRYRVATWGEALPSTARVVTVQSGQAVSLELPIDGGGALH
jgi:plastocyanin